MPPLTLAHALEHADWEAAARLLLLGLAQALESLPAEQAGRMLRMVNADAPLA